MARRLGGVQSLDTMAGPEVTTSGVGACGINDVEQRHTLGKYNVCVGRKFSRRKKRKKASFKKKLG